MDSREPPVSDPDESDDAPDPQAAAAFRQVFELRFEELYRFAYWYVRSSETAKDLVQEAFLRLWRQRDQVDLNAPQARSYLYTVVRYEALDHLRHSRVVDRWRMEYVNSLEEHGVLAPAGSDQELATKEIATAIRRAMETLPRRQRQVLLLRWQQEASYAEIAQTLGISPKTVGIHISRAIQRLREILAQVR